LPYRTSGEFEIDRRTAQDRRSEEPRRSGIERRKGERRKQVTEVSTERRVTKDRRQGQRRGVFDRRSRIGRRFTDRRRESSGAFGAAEIRELRQGLTQSAVEIPCPRCGLPLRVPAPVDVQGSNVWEIHCPACNRTAMITSTWASRVLVVDDEAIVRDALAIVLSKAGHQVDEAGNAESGLRSYAAHPADVVVVDMHMPGLDGIEFIRRLLRLDPAARVVAMAGPRRHGSPDPLVMAKRLGATHILRKPFPPNEVLGVMREVLRRRV
jgi:CheY-like chemotaxis protein